MMFFAWHGCLFYLVQIISSSNGETTDDLQPSILVLLSQILIAVLVLDAWQYFMHRYMHRNKFLFRKVHSQHHRLVVPYAFGALYNHPFEALLDTIGGALSFLLSGMSPRTSIFFFSLAILKTVDDHCGLWLPGNPFHLFFTNNAAYHDVHHQVNGNKYNFSQTFFVMWDKIMGTYMAYALEKRTDGGFEVRPVKDWGVSFSRRRLSSLHVLCLWRGVKNQICYKILFIWHIWINICVAMIVVDSDRIWFLSYVNYIYMVSY